MADTFHQLIRRLSSFRHFFNGVTCWASTIRLGEAEIIGLFIRSHDIVAAWMICCFHSWIVNKRTCIAVPEKSNHQSRIHPPNFHQIKSGNNSPSPFKNTKTWSHFGSPLDSPKTPQKWPGSGFGFDYGSANRCSNPSFGRAKLPRSYSKLQMWL